MPMPVAPPIDVSEFVNLWRQSLLSVRKSALVIPMPPRPRLVRISVSQIEALIRGTLSLQHSCTSVRVPKAVGKIKPPILSPRHAIGKPFFIVLMSPRSRLEGIIVDGRKFVTVCSGEAFSLLGISFWRSHRVLVGHKM